MGRFYVLKKKILHDLNPTTIGHHGYFPNHYYHLIQLPSDTLFCTTILRRTEYGLATHEALLLPSLLSPSLLITVSRCHCYQIEYHVFLSSKFRHSHVLWLCFHSNVFSCVFCVLSSRREILDKEVVIAVVFKKQGAFPIA